jgi:CDP-diacylglycerol--glycerol-3-phosphate 3-phosphatidyltransferase
MRTFAVSHSDAMIAEQTARTTLNLRWTLSNALSALRALLAIPIVFTISAEMRVATILISVFAVITDLLDGYLARRLNEISDLGKILDPLADKIYMAVGVVALMAVGWLEPWFVAVVLARDLVIFLGGIYIERRTGIVLPSLYIGKFAAASLALHMILLLAGVEGIVYDVSRWLTLALLAASLVAYLARGARTLKGEG